MENNDSEIIALQTKSLKNYKVVVLGNTGVGKSSLIYRFVINEFTEKTESTIGAAFLAKIFYYKENAYQLQIWDTAGQEKYRSLAPLYYRDASVAILVYDVNYKNSYPELKKWVNELQSYAPKNILIAVAGNKIDLCKNNEDEEEEIIRNFEINGIFNLTSAKENNGIEDLFQMIVERLDNNLDQKDKNTFQKTKSISFNQDHHKDKNKNCC